MNTAVKLASTAEIFKYIAVQLGSEILTNTFGKLVQAVGKYDLSAHVAVKTTRFAVTMAVAASNYGLAARAYDKTTRSYLATGTYKYS